MGWVSAETLPADGSTQNVVKLLGKTSILDLQYQVDGFHAVITLSDGTTTSLVYQSSEINKWNFLAVAICDSDAILYSSTYGDDDVHLVMQVTLAKLIQQFTPGQTYIQIGGDPNASTAQQSMHGQLVNFQYYFDNCVQKEEIARIMRSRDECNCSNICRNEVGDNMCFAPGNRSCDDHITLQDDIDGWVSSAQTITGQSNFLEGRLSAS